MEKRSSFIFYESFYESIMALPDDSDKLALFNAICSFAITGVEPSFTGIVKAVWLSIRPIIQANTRRYINGRKGGAPLGNENAVKQPKNNLKTTKKQPKNNLKTT